MKLRIKENTVRIRLSKKEVEDFSKKGYLEEQTDFGNNKLVYAIETTEASNKMTANFTDGKIIISVPQEFIKDWPENDVVSLQHAPQPDDPTPLHILVEKDFKCIDNSLEDQSDNYENPHKTC